MQPKIFRLDADISIHALREEGDSGRFALLRVP